MHHVGGHGLAQGKIDEGAISLRSQIGSCGAWMMQVVAVLVRLHGGPPDAAPAAAAGGGVVLVLGCHPQQQELICREVARHAPLAAPPTVISSEVRGASSLVPS